MQRCVKLSVPDLSKKNIIREDCRVVRCVVLIAVNKIYVVRCQKSNKTTDKERKFLKVSSCLFAFLHQSFFCTKPKKNRINLLIFHSIVYPYLMFILWFSFLLILQLLSRNMYKKEQIQTENKKEQERERKMREYIVFYLARMPIYS